MPVEESDNVRARRFQLAAKGIDLDLAFGELAHELGQCIQRAKYTVSPIKRSEDAVAERRPYLPGTGPTEVALSALLHTCDSMVRDWFDGAIGHSGGVRFGVIGSSIAENLNAHFKVHAVLQSHQLLAVATIDIIDQGRSITVDTQWA